MTLTPSKLDTLDEHPTEEHMEVHPAVSLLIARMESNPQEFYRFDPSKLTSQLTNPSRAMTTTNQIINDTKSLWNRKEKRLYNIALRKVRLAEAHERLMAALLTDK